MGGFKQALMALTFGLGLAAGSATGASATTVILDVGTMDHARTVNIAGLGNVLSAPMQFKANYGGKSVNLLAWCVDVYHHITVKDYAPDLTYVDTNTLSTDFNGQALDAGDVAKIGLLANYGAQLFTDTPVAPAAFTLSAPKRGDFPSGSAGTTAYNNAKKTYDAAKAAHTLATNTYNAAVSARYFRLSAVQSAIWQVSSNRNVTSSDATFDLLVDNLSGANMSDYLGAFDTRNRALALLTPVQLFGGRNGTTPLALTQSFAIATGAIPEPTTWLLMIAGFGGVGAALRRKRGLVATA